jgi:hypothetical protein
MVERGYVPTSRLPWGKLPFLVRVTTVTVIPVVTLVTAVTFRRANGHRVGRSKGDCAALA